MVLNDTKIWPHLAVALLQTNLTNLRGPGKNVFNNDKLKKKN